MSRRQNGEIPSKLLGKEGHGQCLRCALMGGAATAYISARSILDIHARNPGGRDPTNALARAPKLTKINTFCGLLKCFALFRH